MTGSMRFRSRSFLLAGISLLVIGSILRLSFFWQPSFTGDEAGHMMKAVSVARGLTDFIFNRNREVALQNIVKPILEHNHPPLEFLVLLPSVPFHPREFSARLIYVLISVATLIVGFAVVYKYRGKIIALAFLALFATSNFLIWFSQMITFGLNLTAGVLISLGVLAYISKPTTRTLLFLVLATVFSLLVSVDFFLFLPAVILTIFNRRNQLKISSSKKVVSLGLSLLALFYVPYIGYSLLPDSPTGAGFIHYKSYLTADRAMQISSYFGEGLGAFLTGKWEQFLGRPGVWTVWPWTVLSLLLLFNKKRLYIRYLWLILLFIIVFEIPAVPCCTVYLNLFGPLLLLAAEGIALFPGFAYKLVILVTAINLFQAQPILQGVPNPVTFRNWSKEEDRIREVGQLVKPCISDDQSYISTEDAWRARYYFGRPMLATVEYEIINEEEAVAQFLKGDLPQIEIIHIHTAQVSETLREQLKIRAVAYHEIGNNEIYFFKKCLPSSSLQTDDPVRT